MPAFNGLYAPYWRTDARGVLVGLSGNVRRAHIARATLEAVAHQSRQLLEAMDAEASLHDLGGGGAGARAGSGSGSPAELKVDGGMTANALLMQFQADVTGRVVVRPQVAETTALGAAYAAGLAVGFWRDTRELAEHWQMSASWRPGMAREAVAASCSDWERAVARSLNWSLGEGAGALDRDPALALLRGAGAAAPGGGGGGGGGATRGQAAAAHAAQQLLNPEQRRLGRRVLGAVAVAAIAYGLLAARK